MFKSMDDLLASRPQPSSAPRPDIDWRGAQTLEQWIEIALRLGHDEAVTALMRTLPEEKRKRYREVWLRVKNELAK